VDDVMPLTTSRGLGVCSVVVRTQTGSFDGNCPEPPTVRARWRFDYPKRSVDRISLCEAHAAALTRGANAGRLKLDA
jgi:hypothetical protein